MGPRASTPPLTTPGMLLLGGGWGRGAGGAQASGAATATYSSCTSKVKEGFSSLCKGLFSSETELNKPLHKEKKPSLTFDVRICLVQKLN